MLRSLRWQIAQTVELKWWKNYLNNKPVSEYLKWKTDYWEKLFHDNNLIPKPGSTCLDAGCGPAGSFIILNDVKLTAIDPLLDKYEMGLPHFSKSRFPSVNFVQTSIEDFKSSEKYDYVYCFNAINHVKNIERCVENLLDLTANGGKLVVSIDSHNFQILKHLFRLVQGDILHPCQYDLGEYREMFNQASLKLSRQQKLKSGFIFDYHLLVFHKEV